MTPRLTNVGDDVVAACPECDVAGEVFERTHSTREYDDRCKCHKCGATFDEPNRREPKPKSTGGSGEDADDGIPAQLDPEAKEMIRSIRGA